MFKWPDKKKKRELFSFWVRGSLRTYGNAVSPLTLVETGELDLLKDLILFHPTDST